MKNLPPYVVPCFSTLHPDGKELRKIIEDVIMGTTSVSTDATVTDKYVKRDEYKRVTEVRRRTYTKTHSLRYPAHKSTYKYYIAYNDVLRTCTVMMYFRYKAKWMSSFNVMYTVDANSNLIEYRETTNNFIRRYSILQKKRHYTAYQFICESNNSIPGSKTDTRIVCTEF